MCPLDAISRDRQILIEEIGGIAIVCQTPANLGGSDDHDVGLLARHPVEGRCLILQVHDISPRDHQLALLLPEAARPRSAHHAAIPRDKDLLPCDGQVAPHLFPLRWPPSPRPSPTLSLSL